jgi:hypothetical protein
MVDQSSRGPRSDDGDSDQIDELKPEVTAPGADNDMTLDNDAADADALAMVRITSNVAIGTGVTIDVSSSADIVAGDEVSFFNGTPPHTHRETVEATTSAGAGGTSFTATTTMTHPGSTIVAETGIYAAKHNTANEGIRKSGTSMAAPHVAGLAALIMDSRTGINAASVKDLIISTSELPAGTTASLPLIDPTWNNEWGWGLVNASAAINLATQTDLTFPSHPPPIGWLSPDISHTYPLKVGQTATVTVKIRNNGPNPANNVRIHFGVHVFSAATPTFFDIGTQIVNIPVNPTGHTSVSIPWVPQAASHQCLKVEIGYSPDTDYSNNHAQRNVTVALSPVQFWVRNTLTEDPARVNLVAKMEYPNAGWTYRIDPPFVMLAADDPPAEIEAELYPPANAPPGAEQLLHVAAVVDTNSSAVALGGISVRHTVSEGLVAYYAFENNVSDLSGNGLDGIVFGDPAFVDGVEGMALDFNGDDYVDCGGNAEFGFTDAMTVSTWVNIRSVTDAWMAIVAKGENAWRLGINNGTTGIHYGFSGGDRGWQQANTATELIIGEWYHVAATYDTSAGSLVYINGVLDASNANLDGIDTNEMPLLLGENPEATGRFFDGALDEIKIYNRALSAGEISNLASLR